MRLALLAATAFTLLPACASPEQRLARLLSRPTGLVRLPPGTVELTREIVLPPAAHDLQIVATGAVLRLSPTFRGRAALVLTSARRVHISGLTIVGNRASLSTPIELIPPENAFRLHYSDNGILAHQCEDLTLSSLRFREISTFPVLISRSSRVRLQGLTIEHSGSRNRLGRNNTTGGVLLEEGTSRFEVSDSTFRDILGNALWTHSLYTSPRNADGLFLRNHFERIGRDAIQVGHATRVRVEHNTGSTIGYPHDAIDFETDGTPVAIDTAGNVDHSVYRHNHFTNLNGKCFDLDGFHHGEVSSNTCTNDHPASHYPAGHFALVMNNNNPDMRSEAIVIRGNLFRGPRFGALYVIGRNHLIEDNRFERLNTSRCTESAPATPCFYLPNEPDLLRAGIYLGRGVRRLEPTGGNTIRRNLITGHRMRSRCILSGPGLSLRANVIESNTCRDEPVP